MVALLAIILSLHGETVDVITSSKVLAERDAKDNKELFSCFNINSDNNCDEECESNTILRKQRYI
jgi:hypothetical protein